MLTCIMSYIMKSLLSKWQNLLPSVLRECSEFSPMYFAHRQPKAPPPQKQPLSPTSPKPWQSVPWSGAAAPPPVPSLLEVMLQEAERETQVLTAPSEPLHLARENTGSRRKSISRGKSSPTVSRCVLAVICSQVWDYVVQYIGSAVCVCMAYPKQLHALW